VKRLGRPPWAAVAVAAAVAIGPAPALAYGDEGQDGLLCDRILEDFSASVPGEFPRGWRTKHEHNAAEAREKGIYVVETIDGASSLHATYGTHTITVVRELPRWDLAEYPVLAWRWRAVRLPTGGDESDPDRNDSAASVYLVWDVGFPFMVADLRFAWSTTLPVGRSIARRFGRARIVIAERGSARDEWRDVHADLLGEARSLLGADAPPSPALMALTTDADATASSAEAFYADFRLCRRVEGRPWRRGPTSPEGEGE
jgi:hypothetical protein